MPLVCDYGFVNCEGIIVAAAVRMWKSCVVGRISKGRREGWKTRRLGFPGFPGLRHLHSGMGASTKDGQPMSIRGGITKVENSVSSLPITRCRAISLLHCLTRRCRVRSWPSAKVSGNSVCKRRKRSLAWLSGCSSNQPSTCGHTALNGSCQVRQSRRPFSCGASDELLPPAKRCEDRP